MPASSAGAVHPEVGTPARPALDTYGLKPAEYDQIRELLHREPNELELALFGAMWSEHCCYKSSRHLLKQLPKDGPQVLVKAGEENAGVVDVGDGWAIAMKIESHNHPSAVEPYQGAATGVGGIVRDVFTMGARPIALLNSLRFGFPDEPRARYLLAGVVAGIGDYGNCLGIPTVAGEVFFDASYRGNPLVNAMCVGLLRQDKLTRGAASGAGNLLLLLGNRTGRDGLHGATFASATLEGEGTDKRPSVQVGSPFLEKLLIEACLELLERGLLVGLQDLGAAGLTSSSVEAASRAGSGVEIDVAAVSRSEAHMTPMEVMLSESQERMLAVVAPERADAVRDVLDRWGLRSDVIGRVVEDPVVRILEDGRPCAAVPVSALTDAAPSYDWPASPTAIQAPEPLPRDPLALLAHPNVASKRWVFREYDQTVQAATAATDDADAALVLLPGGKRAIALSTDGNARSDDPYLAGALAAAEAARNVSCTGATPWAITNCLNFGSPEKPHSMWQLKRAIEGLADAARALDVPVISGNVSLYNEADGSAIRPTPVVGMLGLLDDVDKRTTIGFKRDGDAVVLLGPPSGALDLRTEAEVQRVCREAIAAGIISSAHDCSDGGLLVALAECCLRGARGATIGLALDYLVESPSRIVLSLPPEHLQRLHTLAAGLPLAELGRVGGDRLIIPDVCDLTLAAMNDAYDHGLERAMTR